MVTVNINYVYEEMQENNFIFWKIKDKTSILAMQEDESADIDTSIALLKKKLKGINANFVSIEVSARSATSKAKGGIVSNRTYQVILDGSNTAPIEGRSILNIEGHAEVAALRKENEQLRTQLIEEKYNKQIEGLQAQIQEIKKSDPLEGFGSMLVPILTQMLVPGSAAPQINGHKSEETSWLNLVERFEAADENAAEVFEAIVKLAENKPALYNQYKPTLIEISK